jgi:hypothetical protein
MITDVVLFSALGFLLSALQVETLSAEWWCILGLFLAYGWHRRADGYQDATDTAQAVWQAAHKALEEAKALKQQQGQDTQ